MTSKTRKLAMGKRVLIFLFLSLISSNVWCEYGDKYTLIKFGVMVIKENNATDLTAIGITVGIGMTLVMSFELESNVSVRGGDYNITSKSGNYKVATFGGYLVRRVKITPTSYAKLKGGLILERIDISDDIGQKQTQSKGVNASLGGGFGWALRTDGVRYTFEVELTIFERNLALYGVGLNVVF